MDYQSVRHCSKTGKAKDKQPYRWITSQFDTAPKLRADTEDFAYCWITSQFDTAPKQERTMPRQPQSWITSQFDTAPKHNLTGNISKQVGLPVSSTLLQNPPLSAWASAALDYQSVRHCSKTLGAKPKPYVGWITSQFDTAPKQVRSIEHTNIVGLPVSSTLLQNLTKIG